MYSKLRTKTFYLATMIPLLKLITVSIISFLNDDFDTLCTQSLKREIKNDVKEHVFPR